MTFHFVLELTFAVGIAPNKYTKKERREAKGGGEGRKGKRRGGVERGGEGKKEERSGGVLWS